MMRPFINDFENKNVLTNLKYILELNEIQKNPIPNVYVIPQKNNLREWDGIIFPTVGYYKGGIFRFIIQFSTNHPKEMPKINFLNQLYHPLIDSKTLEINLRMMPEYNNSGNCSHLIEKILKFVNCVLNQSDFTQGCNNNNNNNNTGNQYWNPLRNYTFNRQSQRLYLDFYFQKKQFIENSNNNNNSQFNEFDERNHAFIKQINDCVQLSTQSNAVNTKLHKFQKQNFIQGLKEIKNKQDLNVLLNRTFGQ